MSKYPYIKKFLIAALIMVVIDTLACIFFWGRDELDYILCFSLAGIYIYKHILFLKMDGLL